MKDIIAAISIFGGVLLFGIGMFYFLNLQLEHKNEYKLKFALEKCKHVDKQICNQIMKDLK